MIIKDKFATFNGQLRIENNVKFVLINKLTHIWEIDCVVVTQN